MSEDRSVPEPRGGRRGRVEQIARAFLAPRSPPVLRMGVAGPDDSVGPALAAQALAEAARSLGVPCRLQSATARDEPHLPESDASLVVVDQGGVDEARLDRLSTEGLRGVDALVWTFRPGGGEMLRSLYLLGLWSWAHRPGQVRCLLPPTGPEPEGIEPQLDRIWKSAALSASRELVRLPALIGNEGWRGPLVHLLQATLSRHRPSHRSADETPRPDFRQRAASI